MLTLIESISLAGERAKQNDDACGFAGPAAWVIDGATDLHASPLAGGASDAAWLAHFLNARLHAAPIPAQEGAQRGLIRTLSTEARAAFLSRAGAAPAELWKVPLASLLMVVETDEGVAGLDLGDCRLFTLDHASGSSALGGPPDAADNETQMAAAAAARAGSAALLRDEATLAMLREKRAQQIARAGAGTFCLDPKCADLARAWRLALARPAHILLASDGFAALADRYGAYDAAGLVQAALARGLESLGAELRAIEAGDAAGARHPRWKKSDDATAMLLRLD